MLLKQIAKNVIHNHQANFFLAMIVVNRKVLPLESLLMCYSTLSVDLHNYSSFDICKICTDTQGAFPVTDNRVLNGLLNRSLCLFTGTAHSAHLLCSTPFTGSLIHFAHSLVEQ